MTNLVKQLIASVITIAVGGGVGWLIKFFFGMNISVLVNRIDRRLDAWASESAERSMQRRRINRIKENHKLVEFDDPESLDYKGFPNKKTRVRIGSLCWDNRYQYNSYYTTLCNRCAEIARLYRYFTTEYPLYLDNSGEFHVICEYCKDDMTLDHKYPDMLLVSRDMSLPNPDEIEEYI